MSRSIEIDIFRALGLLLIVLAHVNCPPILHELRSFDVPIMVMCSGLALSYSMEGHKQESYLRFICRRSLRLIVPVWFFLTVYFLFYFLLRLIVTHHSDIPWNSLLRSYLFLNDGFVRYVWIIRVFLLVMIVTPLIFKVTITLKKGLFCLCVLVILLFVDLLETIHLHDSFALFLFNEYLLYLIGYSVLLAFGIRLGMSNNVGKVCNNRLCTFFVLYLIVVLFVFSMKGTSSQFLSHDLKYPPHSLFLLYGITGGGFLWFWVNKILENSRIREAGVIRFLAWIGQNTIWLYLWHIPIKECVNHLCDNWLLRYVLIIFFSLIVYGIQYELVLHSKIGFFVRYFKG